MHLYAYMDESGDLGTGKKATKHFVIGILMTKDPKPIANVIKRVRQRKLKKVYKRTSELKFNSSNELIRKKVLSRLVEKDVKLYLIILEKAKLHEDLKDKKNIVYNYLTGFIMNEILIRSGKSLHKLSIIIDRGLSKTNREKLDKYLKEKITTRLKSPPKIEIAHRNSQEDNCLQMVDFVVGAAFRKIEFKDSQYYDIIKSKIEQEVKLFR